MMFPLSQPRHDWTLTEVEALFALPFMELVYDAATVHRGFIDAMRGYICGCRAPKDGGASHLWP